MDFPWTLHKCKDLNDGEEEARGEKNRRQKQKLPRGMRKGKKFVVSGTLSMSLDQRERERERERESIKKYHGSGKSICVGIWATSESV